MISEGPVDCEKFDRVVLDLLYTELDELTSAAAKRHMEHCSRCSGIGAGLKATREVGVLPLVEPPPGLERRILEAERAAHSELSLRERVGRAISVLAGYAMRPQLAMSALLLLMFGSSLLFLRAKPGDRDSVHVTERGVPESEAEPTLALVPLPETQNAEAAAAHGVPETARESKAERSEAKSRARDEERAKAKAAQTPFDEAMEAYRQGRYAEASRQFRSIAEQGGDKAPSAALFAARATRSSSGCASAASEFDEVHARYPGTSIGNEAAWQAADCYRSLGQLERARRNYQALLSAAGYETRAQEALAHLDAPPSTAVASRKARAAAMPEPRPAEAAPAPTTPAGSTPAKAGRAKPAPASDSGL